MKKQFLAVTVIIAALFLSGCSSDDAPSELDILIEQLQTMQITSETEPEETSEEEITTPDNTEEAADVPDGSNIDSVTYDSVTVTVLSVEEDHITVESEGITYNIIIDDNTQIFGGEISEDKTVTVTYILYNDGSESNIMALFITVLPDNESTVQE